MGRRWWIPFFAAFSWACGSGDAATSTPTDAGSAGSSDGGAGSAGSAGSAGAAGSAGSAGTTCSVTLPGPDLVDPEVAPELTVIGDPPAARGIFDPSVEYPGGAPAGAMSYSAVEATDTIATHIAVSNDAGATWTYVGAANISAPFSVQVGVGSKRCPSGTCSGHLVHEVSSLVFDSDDPNASRRWKLFTHSYMVLPGYQLAYDLGHIALFAASEPLGPWTPEGPIVGWKGESEFSSKDAKVVATDFAQMKDCVAFSEPGALWRPGGVLDLALGCVAVGGTGPTIRIELLRSLDHGASWLYAGRLLSADDASCVGGSVPQLNAADLFFAGGSAHLLASPAGMTSLGVDGYRGCLLFELAPDGASVVRDSDDHPLVKRVLDAPGQRFVGACSASEGASAMGYVASELIAESPPRVFRVFRSGLMPP